MSALDPPTRALVELAAALAVGQQALVAARCRAALEKVVPPVWVDELLLQSVLMLGYPRALGGARAWRELRGAPAEWQEAPDALGVAEWTARGEALCRTVYGASYDRLRSNVRELHPALDAWMVTEGYGRTLARPGLDLVRRELCVIAQVTVLGAERQLHSHLKGALNAGAAPELVHETVQLAALDASPDRAAMAAALWRRLAR
jgi:4-carboxymuconolactone decarboxylase